MSIKDENDLPGNVCLVMGNYSVDWGECGVETANRVLTADVIAALRYWPGVICAGQKHPPEPVDMTVLPPFFNEVLQGLPWWNRDWKFDRVQPGKPAETGDHRCDPAARFTEVSIPGTVTSGNGDSQSFVAKVGFTGDRLIRFQAKIGDVVIGPAVAPAGRSEPHPFGRILTGLMNLRGIPVKDMARAAGLSMSTIHMLCRGHNPNLLQARLIAGVLDMSEADLKVIAGLEDGSTQQLTGMAPRGGVGAASSDVRPLWESNPNSAPRHHKAKVR